MVISVDVSHVFKHPVEFVAKTHFSKYPNAKEQSVTKIDTLVHNLDISSGIDYRKRIATCTNVIPTVLRSIKILDVKAILLEEQAWMDPGNRMLRLKSRNLTWSEYANMWEESIFKPSEENPHWTKLEQKGVIDINGLGPFGRIIEIFAKSFLHAGVKRGLNIMEDLLKQQSQMEQKS